MPTISTSIAGIIPLAGALALTLKGLVRIWGKRDRVPYVPPQPKMAPGTSASIERRPKLGAACQDCGTAIPCSDRLCQPCARARQGVPPPPWQTAVHWLVFIAAMGIVFGVGAIFMP